MKGSILWSVGMVCGAVGIDLQQRATRGDLPYWPTFFAYGAICLIAYVGAIVIAEIISGKHRQ